MVPREICSTDNGVIARDIFAGLEDQRTMRALTGDAAAIVEAARRDFTMDTDNNAE